jgi:hypothetical protein
VIFRRNYRTCTIDVRKATERCGPIDVEDDTAESAYNALAGLDCRLCADGFSPSKVVELDGQICECMHGILQSH